MRFVAFLFVATTSRQLNEFGIQRALWPTASNSEQGSVSVPVSQGYSTPHPTGTGWPCHILGSRMGTQVDVLGWRLHFTFEWRIMTKETFLSQYGLETRNRVDSHFPKWALLGIHLNLTALTT
jgi:hypothetical protein